MAKNRKRKVTAKRNYKDTVFRMLFSDRMNLLSLYNAINGTSYTDPAKLEIVTLENAIYMGMKNDLSFIISTNIFLYEHQSTYNPNMPLRDLFYISSEFQKLINHKSLYSSVLQKIPAPSFIVFYNGTERDEDSWVDYLSNAYENLIGPPNLELKVVTLNINEGHNQELMEQCQILKEYAQYVAKVRNYNQDMPLDAAVELAVNDCIQENILSDFLCRNKAEVIAMSIFEYNKKEEEKKLRKAEFEGGKEAGKEATLLTMTGTLLKLNIPEETILSELIENYKLPLNKANAFLSYCKKQHNVEEITLEKSEGIDMSIFEYNPKEEEKKLRRAEFEGGKEAGKEEERGNSIHILINTLQKLGIPDQTIISELASNYHLPPEKAKLYFNQFSGK